MDFLAGMVLSSESFAIGGAPAAAEGLRFTGAEVSTPIKNT